MPSFTTRRRGRPGRRSRRWIPSRRPSRPVDSPLSEFAVLGFDYGYSVEWSEALVLWEAQFGDFANGAQVIVDQFIASAEDKWRQSSRLGMLLPHGSEGQGPEHSSARVERYLQLCAEGNMQVCQRDDARPVLPPAAPPDAAAARPSRWSSSPPRACCACRRRPPRWRRWRREDSASVLDDPEVGDRALVESILFCSGKVYYDLRAEKEKRGDFRTAIVRLEQLYPFPDERLRTVRGGYPNARRFVWVQEEPKNMGAWSFVAERRRSSCRRAASSPTSAGPPHPRPPPATPPSTSASSSSSSPRPWPRRSPPRVREVRSQPDFHEAAVSLTNSEYVRGSWPRIVRVS